MKPSEYVQIEFLKDCIRRGEQRDEAFQLYSRKFKVRVTDRTIDKRWKIAKSDTQREQQLISEKVNEGVLKEIELRTGKIMGILEKQEILTSIARGELKVKRPFVMKDKIVEYFELMKG